jgi:hypothetical protein
MPLVKQVGCWRVAFSCRNCREVNNAPTAAVFLQHARHHRDIITHPGSQTVQQEPVALALELEWCLAQLR